MPILVRRYDEAEIQVIPAAVSILHISRQHYLTFSGRTHCSFLMLSMIVNMQSVPHQASTLKSRNAKTQE
jgi:hypothetical protein